jgi:hypothetical protein
VLDIEIEDMAHGTGTSSSDCAVVRGVRRPRRVMSVENSCILTISCFLYV